MIDLVGVVAISILLVDRRPGKQFMTSVPGVGLLVPGQVWAHDLQIMILTRCLLRYRGHGKLFLKGDSC